MKLVDLAQELKKHDPLELRGLRTRITLTLLLLFLFSFTAPVEALLPLMLVLCGVIASTLFNAGWILWGGMFSLRRPVAGAVDVLLVTTALHYLGGIETPFYWSYTLIILPYVIFSGKWAGLYVTALSIIAHSFLLLAEANSILPHLSLNANDFAPLFHDQSYLYTRLFGDSVLFCLTFLGGSLIAQVSSRKSRELREANEKAIRMRDTLQQYSSGLEKTITHRTASLIQANEQLRQENTERKQVEKALRESEERYKMLVEEATDIICTIDMKTGTITSANAYAAKALGYEADGVINQLSFIELVHPDDHEKVFNRLREFTLKKQRTPNYPLRLRKADGTYIHVEVNGAITYDADGAPETFIGVLRDVSERKRAEDALQESESRYRTLVDNSLTCVCLIQDGRFKFVNKRLIELSGYSFDELLNMSYLDMVHPEDRDFVQQLALQRLAGQDVDAHHQYRALTKDGRVIWMETFGAVVEHQGRPAILSDLIDITERKQAEAELENSRERLEIIFEYAPDAYYLNDLAGTFLDGNKAAEQLIGIKREQLTGKNFLELDLLPEDQLEKAASIMRENQQGRSSLGELVLKRKDGAKITVEIRTFPVTIKNQPLVLGIARDVTERKRASELLRQSEEKYRTLLDTIEAGFYETDIEGNLLFFNETVCRTLGYTKEELRGMNYRSYVNEQDAEIIFRSFNNVFRTGKADKGFVCNTITKSGKITPVEFTVSLVRDERGRPCGFRGVTRDITDRKLAEEQLRKSEEKFRSAEEKYRTLLDLFDLGYYETDLTGSLVFYNDTIRRYLDYPEEELLGLNYRSYVSEEDAKVIFRSFNRVFMTGKEDKGFVCNVITKNGHTTPVEFSVSLVRDEQGQPVGFRGVTRDVTERKLAEEQLRKSEEKYRSLFEESKEIICITTPDGEILDINPAGVQLFGAISKEGLLKRNIFTYLYSAPGDREKLSKAFTEKGYVKDFELNISDKKGRPYNLLMTANAVRDEKGQIIAYRGIIRDVTEKKQLEQQLFQAQKMESIGTLAGGIAHDFNNLLGGILGYASFIKSKIENGHKFYGYVDTIEKSAMRAAELTSQLLGFARGGKYDTQAIDLNAVVIETMQIITRTFDKSIEIETHLSEQLATVDADAAQIQQVLMNLCVNALDAMPKGGKLIVETELAQLTDDYVRLHLGAQPGTYVTLSVTDTGIGMDKEVIKRIFEPFFTTKEKGKGTGLGLAMVYGVIKNHGGFIRVYSEPGAGSTFKVFLPAAGKLELKEFIPIELPEGGSEAILVVDDEEAIRSLAKDTLEANGYKVLTAENGKDAVEVYEQHRGCIALVILDMVMPKMGGRETFLKMKELNPEIKALLSTGYSQNGKAKEIIDLGVLGFIQKPYQVNNLLAKVRSVLDIAQ